MAQYSGQILFVFPGQGSQYRGIGSDIYAEFPAAKAVYQQASTILGYDIAELSFHGSEEKITLTRFTQPILLTHHIACLRVLQSLCAEHGTALPAYACAGHSLGEYSALVAADILSFEDALRLVQKRGELMGEFGSGEMTALPLDLNAAQTLAEQHYCAVAGRNLAEQTVVGGSSADLDALEQAVKAQFPRKRPVRLKTEGAFHTYYMIDAARRFRHVLDSVDQFAPSTIKVLSNYSGCYHDSDPQSIQTRLFFQLFNPVLWLDCLHTALADGVTTMIEFGGGIGNGEQPSDKRPNLESMIKKAQRGTDYSSEYLAAINLPTLLATAAALQT